MSELSDLAGKTANQIDDWFGTRGVGKHILALQSELAAVTAERDDWCDQVGNLVPALNREANQQRARAETAERNVASAREAGMREAAGMFHPIASIGEIDQSLSELQGIRARILSLITPAGDTP